MCRPISLAALAFCLTTILVPDQLVARDDRRFANSPLKPWFDHLASGKGLCCSFADGFCVQDADWDTQDRVRIYAQWLVVPDDAVVTEPNVSALLLCGPITTVTATPKFVVLCLALAPSSSLPIAFWTRDCAVSNVMHRQALLRKTPNFGGT